MAASLPVEPRPDRLRSPLVRAFVATRPAFLSVTAVAVLVGIAAAAADGVRIDLALAAATLLAALLAHAAGNLVNDWADAGNGGDAINRERIFPFTGGSRLIDNGVLTRGEVGRLAAAMGLAAALGGMALAWAAGPWLFAVGAAGLLLAWAYSTRPLWLVARGLGEAVIALTWLLVVVGADGVQRGAPSLAAAVAGMPLALLVANVLYVNQFPDLAADAAVGKRTLVVRLGSARARGGSALLALVAYGWLVVSATLGALPIEALAGLAAVPLSLAAATGVWRNAGEPSKLAPAIRAAIAAALIHGLALAVALWSLA